VADNVSLIGSYPLLTHREIITVFRLRSAAGIGSAFIHWLDGAARFVTAAHVLNGVKVGDNALIQRDGGWQSITITDIAFSEKLDICAFSTEDFSISNNLPPYEAPASPLGAQLLFLGFPHDLVNNYPGRGYPTPLARGAIFSGVIESKDGPIAILDGFNNPGYSGSPVYARSKSESTALFGVVSSYRPERRTHGQIYRQFPGCDEEVIPDIYTKPNSGMIQVITLQAVNTVANSISRSIPVKDQNPK